MRHRRGAAVLAGAAAAGVLVTGAGCLLDQGGTYGSFSDTTSVPVNVTVGNSVGSTTANPTPSNRPSAKSHEPTEPSKSSPSTSGNPPTGDNPWAGGESTPRATPESTPTTRAGATPTSSGTDED